MRTRYVGMCLAAIVAMAVSGFAAPLAARQGRDSTRAAAAPAARDSAPEAVAPAPATPPGPRLQSRFQSVEPSLTAQSERAFAQEGRMHTLRLSTLALILIGVVVLLLILR